MSKHWKRMAPAIYSLAGVLTLAVIIAAWPARSCAPVRPSQAPNAPALVAKIGERLASYPKLESWQARAHSTRSQMNSAWKPKKTMTSEKVVTVNGGLWLEKILSASETAGGRSRDVTKKLQDEARAREEKRRRSTGDKRKAEQKRRDRRNVDMIREEALPFAHDKRSGYDFTIKGTADLDGSPVLVLQSRSRVRSDEKLEGTYYVHPGTFDVLRAKLTVAKKPVFLKRLEIAVDFQVLPEGYQVMKKAVVRLHLGFVVKNIRVETVETYSDYVVR